ncbi:MAG TPA: ABC transporter permease [Lachnospiraceae bacterium]|nr:ABC transporter permease [Lachnospiraceae bacterium]
MKAIGKSCLQLLVSLKRDAMLLAACLAPVLFGLLFRFGIPVLEGYLTFRFKQADMLSPYYGLFDLLFSLLAPAMLCFAAAMVILEETDDHIAGYFYVTPLGYRGFLASRVLIPSAAAFILTLLLLPLFVLTPLSAGSMLLMVLCGSMQGVLTTMLVVSFSSNKLEGVAVTKISSLLMLGIFAPYFIKNSWQYLFSALPSYWIAKAVFEKQQLFFIPAVFLSGIWYLCLAERFRKKTVK